MITPGNLLSVGCGIAGAVIFLLIAISGCKTVCRERNPGEHFAGVFPTAGVIAAFLGGNTVLCHGNNDLGIPFQPHNRELTKAHIQSAALSAEHQFLIKDLNDSLGNLHQMAFLAVTDLFDLGRQHHRIKNFYRGHQIGIGEF